MFSGEIFENGWLWMAATEQTEITACDVVQFLSMKISFSATFNVDIEFLKKAMLEPILYRIDSIRNWILILFRTSQQQHLVPRA